MERSKIQLTKIFSLSLIALSFTLATSFAPLRAQNTKADSDGQAKAGFKLGDRLAAPKPATANSGRGPAKEIRWEDLSPKDWDPFAAVRDLNLATLKDNDPKAMEALTKLVESRNNAPTVPEMNNQRVRISGFLVPISKAKDDVLEFLLVPYFGACIHTPPPPANMVLRVVPNKPYKGGLTMDAVTVTGQMTIEKTDSPWGAAAYKLDASSVVKYEVPKPGSR